MPSASWDNEKHNYLLDALIEATANGKRSDQGWKKDTWEKIKVELNENFKVRYEVEQLKNAYNNLKKKYLVVRQLRDQSGFGWNNENGTVTASNEAWSTYITSHPEAAKFRSQSFEFYDKMHSLIDGKVATGAHLFGHSNCKTL